MEKSFSMFDHRRQAIQDKLDVMVELDRHLYDPDGPPYVLERHEQMERQMADARDEIEFLTAEMKRIEAGRCPVCDRSGSGDRPARRGRGGR